jgi:ABC-2 type transport system ATP-binding protein
MEEVERYAHKIAIIDHGKIITRGTPAEILAESGSESIEDAFIKITGHNIRPEDADVGKSMMRISSKMMR